MPGSAGHSVLIAALAGGRPGRPSRPSWTSCAGMADLCSYLSAEVGVPVVDGVAAATRTVESLVALGLSTSTRSEYAAPGAKQYVGALRGFTL